MKTLIAGQKQFGADVFRAVRNLPGVEIVAVCSPPGDRLTGQAELYGVKVIKAGTLNADSTLTVPAGIGHGAIVDEDYLDEVTVERWDISA